MKLLLINPNTSEFVTERAVETARTFASPGTVIEGVTGTFGAPIINSEADLAIGAHSALELAAKHAHDFDAVGLAVSFDCGLNAVREILDVPVVGLAEASVREALKFGDRYAVVSFAERTKPLYTKLLLNYVDESQLAMVNYIPCLAEEVLKDENQLRLRTAEIVAYTVQQVDCDSVILLATVFAGMLASLETRKPAVDCAATLVSVLEECVSDNETGNLFKSSVFPERKPLKGVSTDLAACYEKFPSDSNRILL